jgi:hypothetical protein
MPRSGRTARFYPGPERLRSARPFNSLRGKGLYSTVGYRPCGVQGGRPVPIKTAREHAPATLSRATPSGAGRRSTDRPRAAVAAQLLEMQRQAGNRATVG